MTRIRTQKELEALYPKHRKVLRGYWMSGMVTKEQLDKIVQKMEKGKQTQHKKEVKTQTEKPQEKKAQKNQPLPPVKKVSPQEKAKMERLSEAPRPKGGASNCQNDNQSPKGEHIPFGNPRLRGLRAP